MDLSPPAEDAALRATGTSNEALAGRYDEIPYDALPHAATRRRRAVRGPRASSTTRSRSSRASVC